jgi:hypothetical protein
MQWQLYDSVLRYSMPFGEAVNALQQTDSRANTLEQFSNNVGSCK